MNQPYVDEEFGALELPKGYSTVSDLRPSSVVGLTKGLLVKLGLEPIKTRKQLFELEADVLIYALIYGQREKAGLLEYLIAGYIAQKKDFELSQYLSWPPLVTNQRMTLKHPRGHMTLEHPRGLILVQDGIIKPEVIFRTRRDGEVMKDINSYEVNYSEVYEWAGRLFI